MPRSEFWFCSCKCSLAKKLLQGVAFTLVHPWGGQQLFQKIEAGAVLRHLTLRI